MQTTTYRQGPLGYVVIVDGAVVGSIKNRTPRGWQVDVPGLNPATATAGGKLFRGTTVFRTINAAKAAVERILRATGV